MPHQTVVYSSLNKNSHALRQRMASALLNVLGFCQVERSLEWLDNGPTYTSKLLNLKEPSHIKSVMGIIPNQWPMFVAQNEKNKWNRPPNVDRQVGYLYIGLCVWYTFKRTRQDRFQNKLQCVLSTLITKVLLFD